MATAKDWVDTTAQTLFGLQPSDLDPFKDVSLLHSFFSNDIVPKIIAGVTFFAAVPAHQKLGHGREDPAGSRHRRDTGHLTSGAL